MEKRNVSKLTQAQVDEIRRLYAEGYTQGSLCRHFRVSIAQIGRIVRNESWVEKKVEE